MPRYPDLLHWLVPEDYILPLPAPPYLDTRSSAFQLTCTDCGCAPPVLCFSGHRQVSFRQMIVPVARNTLISRQLSPVISALTSEIIMTINQSWLGPIRSRSRGEYRYEGPKEKTDKRPSIFGRARVATLLSLLITTVIFSSLVVCLENIRNPRSLPS